MQYVKKVLVLKSVENHLDNKQKLNGLIRVEIENGVAEIHISLINLPQNILSDYHLLFIDSKKNEFEFNLGVRPTSSAHLFPNEPLLDKGFCVGIYLIKDSLPLLLGFASDCNFFCLQDFKKLIAEKCLSRHKKSIKQETEQNVFPFVQSEIIDAYNDEAVATENYFEIDDEINKKLLSLKDKENESLQFKNELFTCDCQEKEQKDLSQTLCDEDEKDFDKCQKPCSKHFDTVKAELDEIFFKFPEEQSLKNHFKDSRWARIYYSADKYYVVGVICEGGEEKYICYGVPANYSKNPPKELAGFCSFIPLSIFNMFGAGYWIMFQDADSGKCVHFN